MHYRLLTTHRAALGLFLLAVMTAFSVPPGNDAQTFPARYEAGDIALYRKGISKLTVGYIFDVYVAALYQAPDAGPEDVLADKPRHLEIRYLRGIDKDAFVKAAEDMLAKQNSPDEIAGIRDGISQINALYQNVQKGDCYSLTYIPGLGTELRFNGQSKGVIPGTEFARVYFTIWLGEHHPYQRFRDRLVGLPPR